MAHNPTNRITYKFLFALIFILSLIFIARKQKSNPCESRINYQSIYSANKDIDYDALYAPITKRERQAIAKEWAIPPIADTVEILYEGDNFHQRKIQLLAHTRENQRHYSALIYPSVFEPDQKYPLLVWANGLNQKDPIVNLEHLSDLVRKVSPYYFIAIPSFRGQSLRYFRHTYCSDGFFGDAFDGAATDALTLMNLCIDHYPIDTTKIIACGQSRGGTVALLMGARSAEIDAVISLAGPTNFFDRAVLNRYRMQYLYQFLSEQQPLPELRKKIIKSSPLHFYKNLKGPVYIYHGAKDATVPVQQANILLDSLYQIPNIEVYANIFPNRGHDLEVTKEPMEIINSFAKPSFNLFK
jgi:hypothetical protein